MKSPTYLKRDIVKTLKIDKTKVLKIGGSLVQVKNYAECSEHSEILLPCIKRLSVLKTYFWSTFE